LISRSWSPGDKIDLKIKMPVHKVLSHPEVKENQYKLALERGPLVYCAEEADNGSDLFSFKLPLGTEFDSNKEPDLLNGPVVLKGKLKGLKGRKAGVRDEILLIPYYAWAHRGTGKMAVWIHY